MKLSFFFRDANEKYATDYPAAVGNHMTNTDSTPFMDLVRRSAFAKTSAECRPAQAGIRPGISRPMCTRHSAIRISVLVSTLRKQLWAQLGDWRERD